MEFHPQDVIISLINIAVLFILLRFILFKRVNHFLKERANRVRGEMDDAEKHRLEAEALHTEYEERIESIEARGRDILHKSQLKANAESDKIINETRDKAREMISDAQVRIAEEKEQALEEANLEVTQLATEMAARILRREVSEADNTNVVDEFFRD